MALPIFTSFGSFLRHLRKRANLSQRDLAAAVGYSEAHISRLESGERLPDTFMVSAQFLKALDLEHEPELAAQLVELAAAARGETLAESHITFHHTAREKTTVEVATPVQGDLPPSKTEAALVPQAPSSNPVAVLTAGLAGMPGSPHTGVEQFLHEYLGAAGAPTPFAGREAQLVRLDRWLDDPEQPYALLVAPAGRGKSALLAQWLARVVEQGRTAVVFLPISIRFGTARKSTSVSILGARLRHLHGVQAALPRDPEVWIAEIDQYLRADYAGSGQLLLVLDGIDEAIDWECGRDVRFPPRLGRGVKVLVAARAVVNCDSSGWLRRLEWPDGVLALDLQPLSQLEIAAVLAQMGEPLRGLATKIDVVGELHRISAGDPLLVRLYVEALRTEDADVAFLKPENLPGIPPGLDAYFERWWEDQRRQWGVSVPLWEPTVRTLLTALACALGPLTTDDLLTIASEPIDTWALDEALRPLARFVIGDGRQQGYVFSHPRLHHYFYEKLTIAERATWERRFVNYGKQTLVRLDKGSLAPQDVSRYVVRFYGAHLQRVGANLTQWNTLISARWLQAWEAIEGTYSGFLSDLHQAWLEADRAGAALQDVQRGVAIGLQCRYLLIQTSINSLTSNLPPALIVALVRQEIWSPIQGLSAAQQLRNEDRRIEALVKLAAVLPEALLLKAFAAALAAAEQSGNERTSKSSRFRMDLGHGDDKVSRSEALATFFAILPRSLLDEAMAKVQAIQMEYVWERMRIAFIARLVALEDLAEARKLAHNLMQTWQQAPVSERSIGREDQARMLIELARNLPEFLEEALNACIAISHYRGPANLDKRALANLAPLLSEPLARRALMTVRATEDARIRARDLADLYPYVSAGERPGVLAEALEAARMTDDSDEQVTTWIALAPHLHPDEQQSVLAEALEVALKQWEQGKGWTLRKLIPHLPESLLADTLSIVQSALDFQWDTFSLREALAIQLAAVGRAQDALVTARAIKLNHGRILAMNEVGAQMAHVDDPQHVLELVETTEDVYEQVGLMTALIAELPESLQATTLSMIRRLDHKQSQVWALERVTPYLPASLLKDTLSIAQEINDIYFQISTLIDVDGVHEALDLVRTLPVVQDINDIHYRPPKPFILVHIIPRLHASERNSVITEVLATVRVMRRAAARAHILRELILHLPGGHNVEIVTEALTAARAINAPGDRVNALTKLVPHVPPAEQPFVLTEALAATRAIDSALPRVQAFTQLIPLLPAGERSLVLAEALSALEFIDDLHWCVSALTQWAPYVPIPARAQILAETLTYAQRLDAPERHPAHLASGSRMLIDLAVRLAAEGYLDEAWSIARAIDHAYWRVEALLRLSAYLPQAERPAIVAEALTAARTIRKGSSMGVYGVRAGHWVARQILDDTMPAKALARIAPHLPGDECLTVLNEAINVAQTKMGGRTGDFALAGLAPHMAALGFPEQAYTLAQHVAYPSFRAQALAALVQHLPGGERAAVFAQALAIVHMVEARRLVWTLDDVIPYLKHVPPMEWYPLWCEMIHLMARKDRDAVLPQIRTLMPVITSLGGQDTVALVRQAIVEVGQWFP